jgi:nitroreductase
MDVFEAMGTCRAMRYLKADPVPDELIEKLVWAATRAPSPANTQGWDFVVITDVEKRQQIGDALQTLMAPRIEQMIAGLDGAESQGDDADRRTLDGALHLAQTIGQAPVIFLIAGQLVYPPGRPVESFVWSAIYPAAANLVVAARALGLGSVFTTFHAMIDPLLREILQIPAEVRLGALIPVGWPDRPFTSVSRKPVSDVIHRDTWNPTLRSAS